MEKSWKTIKKRKSDSEPVYGGNDKFIKIKIKIYGGNFQGKKMKEWEKKGKAPWKKKKLHASVYQ